MGTLLSAFGLGLSGLHVAQVQLDVTGHNITNVNTEGYSRQRAEQTTFEPLYRTYGPIGRGVTIQDIRRARNIFLDTVYRQQIQEAGASEIKQTYFNRLEDILSEPSEDGLGERLNLFFDALNDFAGNVEDTPTRTALLSEAEAVTGLLNDVAERIDTLRTDANEELRNTVPQVNALAESIATLNGRIQVLEGTGQCANDLRDDRDRLLDELSELVSVTIYERDDGIVDVTLGSDQFITATSYNALTVAPDPAIDPDHPELLTVRFEESGRDVNIQGGTMLGIIESRDVEIKRFEDNIDELARGLIAGINRIHTQSNGMLRYEGTLQSANVVADTGIPINDNEHLPYTLEDGSFDVVVYDTATGAVAGTITVSVTAAGTTLNDIASAINAAANLSATTTPEGYLEITGGAGYAFSFANDSSGALTAIGANAFFSGYDAGTIGVSQDLIDDPRLISSRYSLDPLETGDNTAALALAAVRDADILSGDSQTLNEYYESTVVDLGVRSRLNSDTYDAAQVFANDLEARRQEVSGVSLDEEVAALLVFQRAFEASARILTVADSMIETLLNST